MPHDAARVAVTRGWLLKARGTLEPVCRRAERLTPFAWIFRYPGDAEEPPAAEIADALALAREVYNIIVARLPAEVWPPG